VCARKEEEQSSSHGVEEREGELKRRKKNKPIVPLLASSLPTSCELFALHAPHVHNSPPSIAQSLSGGGLEIEVVARD
jgi:hypothetical protein